MGGGNEKGFLLKEVKEGGPVIAMANTRFLPSEKKVEGAEEEELFPFP